MPVLVVGSEKSFAALRARLFAGRVSPAAAKRVAEAIRSANPHADLDALRPGTVLSIPDLPEVSVGAELSLGETPAGTGADLYALAGAALDEVAARAREVAAERAAERKQVARALQARAVKEAAAEDAALAADVESTRQAVAAAEAEAEAQAIALTRAHKGWSEDLEELRRLLG